MVPLISPGIVAREATRTDIERRFAYCTAQEKRAWADSVQRSFEALWDAGGLFGIALDGPLGPVEGLALAGFLSRDFAEHILKSRTPYMANMAFAWLAQGRRPLLPDVDSSPEVFAAEAGMRGIHMHLFEFHWQGGLETMETMPHRAYLAQALSERTFGCPLEMITIEAHPAALESVLRGGFNIVNEYPDAPEQDQVKLCGANRTAANTSSHFWLMQAFAPGRPTLRLSSRQRRILFHFRAGLSDQEIAARVFLSPRSMKNYWSRIFEAFQGELPGFGGDLQKRRSVFEYLKTHPEEAWPYRKPK